MPVPTVSSSDPIEFGIFFETTPGTPPADAAAWIAGEGTTVYRCGKVEGVDPAFIRRLMVRDPAITDTLFGENDPIPGLRNADGGGVKIRIHGTGVETSAGSQVAETYLGKLLKHMLGGSSRTYSSDVTSSASAILINPATTTGMNEGEFVACEDDDDPGRCFPGQIRAWDGTTFTLDQNHGITWTSDDHIHGCEVNFLDPDALSNPADANASTLTIYIRRGNQAWMVSGCKLQLNALEITRGEPWRMDCSIYGARAFPPGDSDNPGVISFTGTIQGSPGLPAGADTKLWIQDKDTTTQALVNCQTVKIVPGYEIVPGPCVTEATDNMEGRAGYHVRPTQGYIEATIYWDEGYRADFEAKTKKVARYYQVAAPGFGYFVHSSQCVVDDDPAYSDDNNSNMMTVKLLLQEDRDLDGLGADDNLTRSKFIIGRL
jgi:hypothetical protein